MPAPTTTARSTVSATRLLLSAPASPGCSCRHSLPGRPGSGSPGAVRPAAPPSSSRPRTGRPWTPLRPGRAGARRGSLRSPTGSSSSAPRERRNDSAIWADSFMTSPSWPVSTTPGRAGLGVRQGRLDEQHVAAGARDPEPGRDAWHRRALRRLGQVLGPPDEVRQPGRGDQVRPRCRLQPRRDLAQHAGEHPLEVVVHRPRGCTTTPGCSASSATARPRR